MNEEEGRAFSYQKKDEPEKEENILNIKSKQNSSKTDSEEKRERKKRKSQRKNKPSTQGYFLCEANYIGSEDDESDYKSILIPLDTPFLLAIKAINMVHLLSKTGFSEREGDCYQSIEEEFLSIMEYKDQLPRGGNKRKKKRR